MNNMNYKKFIIEVRDAVQKTMGNKAVVTIQESKNFKQEGLIISKPGEEVTHPIYLKEFYNDFLKGNSLDNISRNILTDYYSKRKKTLNIDLDSVTKFASIESKIVYKLINYEKNITLLKNIPYKKYLDMAIVFYCLGRLPLGNSTVLINNKQLDIWGVDVETLYQIACINTPKLVPVIISTLEGILVEEFGEEFVELCLKKDNSDSVPSFVISNVSLNNGAACILYKDVLKDFAEVMKSDIYVLPSSSHEIIVVPKNESNNPTDLKQLIAEANANFTTDEEQLSNNLYEFRRSDNELRIVC